MKGKHFLILKLLYILFLSGAVMAATFLIALIFFEFFTSFVTPGATYTDINHRHKHNAYFSTIRKGTGTFCAFGYHLRVPMRLELSLHGFHKSRLPRCSWTIHGYTCLLVPGHDPPQDITIFMDVSVNPGPDLTGSLVISCLTCLTLRKLLVAIRIRTHFCRL